MSWMATVLVQGKDSDNCLLVTLKQCWKKNVWINEWVNTGLMSYFLHLARELYWDGNSFSLHVWMQYSVLRPQFASAVLAVTHKEAWKAGLTITRSAFHSAFLSTSWEPSFCFGSMCRHCRPTKLLLLWGKWGLARFVLWALHHAKLAGCCFSLQGAPPLSHGRGSSGRAGGLTPTSCAFCCSTSKPSDLTSPLPLLFLFTFILILLLLPREHRSLHEKSQLGSTGVPCSPPTAMTRVHNPRSQLG